MRKLPLFAGGLLYGRVHGLLSLQLLARQDQHAKLAPVQRTQSLQAIPTHT
jgi:hypothetical protein